MIRSTERGVAAVSGAGRSGADVQVEYRLDRLPPEEDGPGRPLVVCLHGWSMDEDWFARLLHGALEVPADFLFPRGPFPVERRDGSPGWSWYDYDGDTDRFVLELQRLERLILGLIDHVEKTHDLSPWKRALVGFSQGGYGGSYAAISNPNVFQGLAISGARIKAEVLASVLPAAAAAGFRVLACHGERDSHVDPDRSRASIESLRRAGITIEWRPFDAGHSLGRHQVAAIRDWLGPTLGLTG